MARRWVYVLMVAAFLPPAMAVAVAQALGVASASQADAPGHAAMAWLSGGLALLMLSCIGGALVLSVGIYRRQTRKFRLQAVAWFSGVSVMVAFGLLVSPALFGSVAAYERFFASLWGGLAAIPAWWALSAQEECGRESQ